MKWPNLKHLYYLVVLHEEQHFNRAAKRCFVSQSTLSTAIQNLEEHFGCQMLERDHKTFIFTPFGHEVVQRSRALLNQASDLLDFVHSAGDWQAGKLRLGVIPTIAPFMLEPLINEVQDKLPKLNLQIQEDTTSHLLQQLNNGELDLLVLALPMETPGCKQLVIGHDPFHLVAHPEMLEQLPSPLDYSQLPENSVFLLQQEHCMTGHAVSACGLRHSEQVSALAASSLFTLVQLANSKLGLTFLPELALKSDVLAHTQLVSFPAEDRAFREIGLVWRSGTTRMRLFRRLAEVIAPLMPKPKL
ncbi:putative HTH-type transcriptional regulator YraN [Saliniradius amylolyticus]|uniref:Putative HTH-type transcriptional regulator YraN n=1 Tax=Saliniradius amylolyticus TaxID=2183582 RepID=A0A2S2E2N3_9ALTE|nr:hydrogen peroxide-inducible genes activator [Saliniradius amylolyticus]AWL11277.1 putative HTH-type transcriptional regulator YraN [Saliniradius amylolyticus]